MCSGVVASVVVVFKNQYVCCVLSARLEESEVLRFVFNIVCEISTKVLDFGLLYVFGKCLLGRFEGRLVLCCCVV